MKPWILATVVVGTTLFVLACRNDFYQLTSPEALSWHVALRKAYSIVAFALVAYLLRRALEAEGRPGATVVACVAGLAAYSAAIEVGQYVSGSREGPVWNAIDIGCGAVGGALAVSDRLRTLLRAGRIA